MTGPRLSILLCSAAGIALLCVLAAIPLPGPESSSGSETVGVAPHTDPLVLAIQTGDATRALARLHALPEPRRQEPAIARALDILRAETNAPVAPPDDIEQRLRDAAADPAAMLALLREATEDSAIAADTESLFRPAARRTDIDGIDAIATRYHDQERRHDPVVHIEVARAYRRAERPRARLRWLLRGLATNPTSRALRAELVTCYLELGRMAEAYAVHLLHVDGDESDLDHIRRRAELARWLSRPTEEAAAIEALIEHDDDPSLRVRLTALRSLLGETEPVRQRAVQRAESTAELVDIEAEAHRALEAGDTDEGLDLLREIAARSDDPLSWHTQIAALALQDLRIDEALDALHAAHAATGSAEVEREIEALLRRTDRQADLLALLSGRLLRLPWHEGLRQEVIALHRSLRRTDELEKLLATVEARRDDATSFFRRLEEYDRVDVPALSTVALTMARSAQIEPRVLAEVLSGLRPHLDRPRFRDVATALAMRFPHDPTARSFLIALIDRHEDPTTRAEAAARARSVYPDDPVVARIAADRAGWANAFELEVEARRALTTLQPLDDANLERLARLYERLERHDEAVQTWKTLVERRGAGSVAFSSMLSALHAAGLPDAAFDTVVARARRPDATTAQRIEGADMLFGAGRTDDALRLYVAALDLEPEHAHALLRVGMILFWAGDRGGALAYLERHHAVVTDGEGSDAALARADVEYHLGEAYRAVGRPGDAMLAHEQAVRTLARHPDLSDERREWLARMLVHLDRKAEACPHLRVILTLRPEDVALRVDYADALIATGDTAGAREHVDVALGFDPANARALRLAGLLDAQRADLDAATRNLTAALRETGPDADLLADLARAQEGTGDWQRARESYGRWWRLRPEDRSALENELRLRDELSDRLEGHVRLRFVEDDLAVESRAIAAFLLADDRTRVELAFGHGHYEGIATTPGGVETETEEDVGLLDVAVTHRVDRNLRIGAGITAYPGSEGSLPAGFWAHALVTGNDPFWSLSARLGVQELWTWPAGAAGLGGRRHGIDVAGYADLGGGFWTAGEVGISALEIHAPGFGHEADGRLAGAISLGSTLLKGDPSTTEPRPLLPRARLTEAGPFLVADGPADRQTMVNVWLSYQPSGLLDDRQLARIVPISSRNHYLSAAGRVDHQLGAVFGSRLEAYLGADLRELDLVWGMDAAVTWRPSLGVELSVTAGVGSSLERSGDLDQMSGQVTADMVIRW